MTTVVTVADVLRTAEEVHDRGDIYRDPYGWRGYVSIQQKPPYPPEHFGRMHIDHCGASVARVYWLAGLREPDVPPYYVMQYTPSLYNWRNSPARVGAAACMNWKPGDGEPDHIALVVGGEHVDADGFVTGSYIDVWETNTDPSGRSKYTRYPVHYFEGFHMPEGLRPAPTITTMPAIPEPPPYIPSVGAVMADSVTIHEVPKDGIFLRFHVVDGVLTHPNPEPVYTGEPPRVVRWQKEGQWEGTWYRDYCRDRRLNPLTGEPL